MIKTILEVIVHIIMIGIFMYGGLLIFDSLSSMITSEIPCFSNEKELKRWLRRDMKDYIESCEDGTEVIDFTIENISENYSKAWYEIKHNGSGDINLLCVLIKNKLEPYKVVYYGPNGREVFKLD